MLYFGLERFVQKQLARFLRLLLQLELGNVTLELVAVLVTKAWLAFTIRLAAHWLDVTRAVLAWTLDFARVN